MARQLQRMKLALLAFLLIGCAPATAQRAPQSDAAWYARDNGVSLEEAERRLARQPEIGAVQQRLNDDPRFAGLWIEHQPTYRVVVRFTGDDAAAHLAQYTRDAFYVAQGADYSYAQLREGRTALHAQLDRERVYVMSSSVDVRRNRLVLDVVSEPDTRREAAAHGITFPDFVAFDSHGGILAVAQTMGPITNFPQMRVPSGIELGALGRGRLAVVNGCVRLRHGDDLGHLVIWPSSALLERAGDSVAIRDQRSGNVVRLGDQIEIGGGESDALDGAYLTGMPPNTCPGPYWLAATGWRRAS